MIYTPNNNNFVQSSTAEYGGFYGSTYTSLTQEYAKIFNTSKTDDTVKSGQQHHTTILKKIINACKT